MTFPPIIWAGNGAKFLIKILGFEGSTSTIEAQSTRIGIFADNGIDIETLDGNASLQVGQNSIDGTHNIKIKNIVDDGTDQSYVDINNNYIDIYSSTNNSIDADVGIYMDGDTPTMTQYLSKIGAPNSQNVLGYTGLVPYYNLQASQRYTISSYTSSGTTELIYGRKVHTFSSTAPSGTVKIDKSKSGDELYLFNSTASTITFGANTTETFNGVSTLVLTTGQTALVVQSNGDGVFKVQNLGVGAATTTTVISKTANYTLVNTDSLCLVDGSGGAFNITLPTSPVDGQSHTIKRTDNTPLNAVSLVGTIDGTVNKKLFTQYESWVIQYTTASGWTTISHFCGYTFAQTTIPISNTGLVKGTTAADLMTSRRDGKYLILNGSYQQTASGSGNNGTGTYKFTLPAGLSLDTTEAPEYAIGYSQLYVYGSCMFGVAGQNWHTGNVVFSAQSATQFAIQYITPINSNWNEGIPIFNTNDGAFSFHAQIPILGWND